MRSFEGGYTPVSPQFASLSTLPSVCAPAVLLVWISFFWLFHLFISADPDIARDEIPYITFYVTIVLMLEVLLLLALRRLVTLVMPLLAVLNTYSLYFVFSADMNTKSLLLQTIILLGIGVFYVALTKMVQRLRLQWLLAGVLLSVTLVGFLEMALVNGGPVTAKEATPKFKGTKIVTFVRRPNVYFLGFDSLMPARLASRLLNLSPPYLNVILRHGGSIVPNLFADGVPTMRFWVTTMNILPAGKDPEFVVGIKPSVLLATFLHNGYDTHLSYINGYFGPKSGPYLTTYAFSQPYSSCSFLRQLPQQYGFLGYCAWPNEANELHWDKGNLEKKKRDWRSFYLDQLRRVTRGKSGPHFFVSHYPLPGHTEDNFQRTDEEVSIFRHEYQSRSEEAAEVIDEMLTEIRDFDPTAIVFIFGDHGSLISKPLWYDDDPHLVVPDRHGIMGAFFGSEECTPFLRSRAGQKIQTSSQVVASLLQCLAGGESPLVSEYDFGKIGKTALRFEDFAYDW